MADEEPDTGTNKEPNVEEEAPVRPPGPGMVIVPAGGNVKELSPNARWIFSSTGQAQFVHHKTFPIKRADGEPLMREDLQYDFLMGLFGNNIRCFTDMSSAAQTKPRHPSGKATFGELYINAILSSNKCTKIQRDKMNDAPTFARDFAMMCLLVNVGRVNTTLAFYPEMRTVLRTYHPVPALQKTDGNLQDAPRMKSVLKACLLPEEAGNAPTTPQEIRALKRGGRVPATSIVNLIFALTNHSTSLSRQHFPSTLDFHDLFLPINISSKDRARAFLWLMFEYLEDVERPNPFAPPEWTSTNPDMVPPLTYLTQQEMEMENDDPPDERELARKLITNRRSFLQEHVVQDELQTRADSAASNKKKRAAAPPAGALVDNSGDSTPRPSPSKKRKENGASHGVEKPVVRDKVFATPVEETSPPLPPQTRYQDRPGIIVHRRSDEDRRRAPINVAQPDHKRTPFAQAFKIVTFRDALYDSDDELDKDENARLDYQRRLEVLRLVRGRDVTPEPESEEDGVRERERARAMYDYEHERHAVAANVRY